MIPRPIGGIIFDMDGVIIDSHPAHRAAWKGFLESVGITISGEELEFILDGRKREEILKHFLGELGAEQIAEYGNRKDELLRTRRAEIQPVPGVIEFLENLSCSGIPAALATSAGRQRAQGTLQELGLNRYFQTIVTGDDVTAGKPDPAIYRLAAQRLQQDPTSLIAVEDAVSGVKSATSAGMRCLGVADSERAASLRAAGAYAVIEDFRSFSLDQLKT